MDTKMMDLNKIDIIKPTLRKACECFGLTCSYCRQDALQPSPIHSYWSNKDWNGKKANAREEKSLVDFETPKQEMDKENVTDIDKVPFHKLK